MSVFPFYCCDALCADCFFAVKVLHKLGGRGGGVNAGFCTVSTAPDEVIDLKKKKKKVVPVPGRPPHP